MEIKLITPDVAEAMLKKNLENNRNYSLNNIYRYSEMMKKGLWINLHPQPFIISNEGELLDGQHRLRAIVMSGITIKAYVAIKDKSIMPTIDDGKKRSPGDSCKIANIPNANTYSSIMRMYSNSKIDTNFGKYLNRNSMSNIELIEEYYKNPEYYQEIIHKSRAWYHKGRLMSASLYGALFMRFGEIDNEAAVEFFDQLTSGKDILNNTIYLLRQRLINEKSNLRKTPISILVALIIKTWNACINDYELKSLQYQPLKEKYPQL
jgi:hypothetical protein